MSDETTIPGIQGPPCRDCTHEVVCGLRSAYQTFIRARFPIAGELPAGLAWRIAVDCKHFLPAAVHEIAEATVELAALREIEAAQGDPTPGQAEQSGFELAPDHPPFAPEAVWPVPLPEHVPSGDRTDFTARAKARAGEVWSESHEAVAAPPETDPLTKHQRRVLETVMRLEGDRRAAAEELGVVYQSIDGALEHAGRKGVLPVELIAKLPARFAQYAAVAS